MPNESAIPLQQEPIDTLVGGGDAGNDVCVDVEAVAGSGPADDLPGSSVLEDVPLVPAVANNVNPDGDTLDSDAVKFEYRCKICQLSVRAPSLYRRVHELVLKDRQSYGSALADINAYITQHGLDLKLLNMVNMSGHFGKHISMKQRVALVVTQAQPAPAPLNQQVQAIAPMLAAAIGTEVDDFRNLEDIRRRITNQMLNLEGQLQVIDPKTNQLRLDKMALSLFVTLTSETRACINDLNKMRQSERLMNTVVQQLLDRMTFAIIPQLLEEYSVIGEELRHHRVEPDVVRMIDERLRTKTAQIIATTARAAVTEVQRQFKLR